MSTSKKKVVAQNQKQNRDLRELVFFILEKSHRKDQNQIKFRSNSNHFNTQLARYHRYYVGYSFARDWAAYPKQYTTRC